MVVIHKTQQFFLGVVRRPSIGNVMGQFQVRNQKQMARKMTNTDDDKKNRRNAEELHLIPGWMVKFKKAGEDSMWAAIGKEENDQYVLASTVDSTAVGITRTLKKKRDSHVAIPS